MDGVLVDTKQIHFLALNEALDKVGVKNKISYENHLKNFDGLPTVEKLKKLNKKGALDKKKNNKVKKLKKLFTSKILKKEIKFNKSLFDLFKKLSKKYKIAVATNAIGDTLEIWLDKLKIKKFVNFGVSN